MSNQGRDCILADCACLIRRGAEALLHCDGDRVDRTTAERVVRVRLEECLPRVVCQRSGVVAVMSRERHPRPGVANQRSFDTSIPTLLVGARSECALEGPRKAVGVTEL